MRSLSLLGWLIGVPAILVASAAAIILLIQQVENSHREELLLTELAEQAARINALEWECIATLSYQPEKVEEAEVVLGRMSAILDESTALYATMEEVRRVTAAFSKYRTAIQSEFRLIAVRRFADARELDEKEVDPAHVELASAITEASELSNIHALHATRWVRWGSLWVMAISVLAIGFLVWQFENGRKRNEVVLAEKRSLHQNEEQLQAYADETAALYRKLDGAARQVADLMRRIVDDKDYSVRFVNPLLVRCWEIMGCHDEACPAYGRSGGPRCWETRQTLCKGKVQAGGPEKARTCRECKVYQAARKDSMSFLGESFNEMIVMIADRQQALVTANQRLGEANTQAREMALRAEAAATAKSEFLANMSHEIRTPMTAILGYTNILVGSTENPEHLEALNVIQRNSDHLLRIINDILDLSKIEVGKLEVERVTCAPLGVLTEVVSLMRVQAAEKKLPLKLGFNGPCPETILTDHTRLRQILFNLIGNAIKFTEIGEVCIVVRLLARNTPRPKMCFEIVDTGVGMAADQVQKLFQPFQQADASTTRKFGGTGLGLAVSKRLAKLLGGDVTVSSELGKGSTFTVTIDTGPLTDVPLIEHPTEAVASAVDAKVENSPPARLTCHVLLAEDGPDNQRLISLLLKKAGAQVTVAENGKKAMELALANFPGWGRRYDDSAGPFDVILMDMQMPVMDGYEATRRLRAEGYNLPIIALTAHAMTEDMQKCLDAGCDAYLSKPIHREKFLATIAQYAARTQCKSGQSPTNEPKPSDECAS